METLEEKLPFQVDSDEKAMWAMRRLYEERQTIAKNETLAKKEVDRILKWLETVNATAKKDAAYFEEQLLDYGRRERDKRKTITLPHGKIKSWKTPDKVELDAEFIDWAAGARDDLLTYQPPKPNLNEIKRQLKSGEKLEHAILVPGSVTFCVEVSE